MAKLKYIGKQSIRTTNQDGKEVNLHNGEVYDESQLTGDYLKSLIAQKFFESTKVEKPADLPAKYETQQTPKP